MASTILAAMLVLAACAPLPDDERTYDAAAALDAISSCEEVGDAVEPYITDLVLSPMSSVDENGVVCKWRSGPEARDLETKRSVDVLLVVAGDVDAPDASEMANLDGITVIEDDWLAARDGIAYAFILGNEDGGVITTTVWVPGVVATISGSQWSDLPSLDGRAAVDVVEHLLG